MSLGVCLLLALAVVMTVTVHGSKDDVCVECAMILAGLTVLSLSLAFVFNIPFWFYPTFGFMYLAFFIALGVRRYWFPWGRIAISATATLVWLAPVLKEVIRI